MFMWLCEPWIFDAPVRFSCHRTHTHQCLFSMDIRVLLDDQRRIEEVRVGPSSEGAFKRNVETGRGW